MPLCEACEHITVKKDDGATSCGTADDLSLTADSSETLGARYRVRHHRTRAVPVVRCRAKGMGSRQREGNTRRPRSPRGLHLGMSHD